MEKCQRGNIHTCHQVTYFPFLYLLFSSHLTAVTWFPLLTPITCFFLLFRQATSSTSFFSHLFSVFSLFALAAGFSRQYDNLLPFPPLPALPPVSNQFQVFPLLALSAGFLALATGFVIFRPLSPVPSFCALILVPATGFPAFLTSSYRFLEKPVVGAIKSGES